MLLTVTNMLNSEQVQWLLTCTRFEEWLKTDLFHFNWWCLLALAIICIYIWLKTIDKSRLSEIVLYATLVAIMILIFDELGEELTLWYYPTDIFPLFPPIAAINLSCLPLVYSLMYQYFKSWKSFIIASAVMSIISCFVLEPLFIWTGIYKLITWKSYYGLPLYFFIAVVSKFCVDNVCFITSKAQKLKRR